MNHRLQPLMDQGVALKRQGNLEGARDCYIQALKEDPTEMMIYINLGKVAHLLRSQDLAIRSYLASAHLQIGPVEAAIQNNQLPMHLKIQYDSFSKDVLVQLPKKSAFIIFIDPNTSRHLAHSLIDLSPDKMRGNPELSPYAEIYHAHIFGNGSYESIIQRHRLTSSDQINMDEETYIPLGRKFLVEHLKWDQLSTTDVLKLYF
ncbi:tetratricopeptide repeat protein [Paenibacillus borealis]|uniref:Uncharacterized protein n=1 Tax=Paenibacillus borealis TaxID=160799 RepID=A0A089L3V7_PAEBO|nr:tetratricopeptide repeat protein [Paenibacillus borealis]AIQ56176.1 hypothetical protein PBOR_03800 [Paenibacillus borealis]